MKRQSRILAGTALGLIMATAQLGAAPLAGARTDFDALQKDGQLNAPVILAQATEETEEQRLQREAQEAQDAAEEAPVEEAPAEEAPAAEEPAAEEPAAEEAPAEAPAAEEAPAEEPAPEEAPAAEEAPAEEPAAQDAPAEEPAAEEAPVEAPAAEEAPAPEEAPAEEPAAEEAPAEEPAAQEAPAEAPAAEEAPAPEEAPAEQPAAEEAPAEEPAAQEAPAPADAAPAEEAPAEDAAPAEGAAPTEQAPVEGAAPAEGQAEVEGAVTQPAEPGEALQVEIPPEQAFEETEDLAPILDSQKVEPAEAEAAFEAEAAAEGETPEQIEEERARRARPAGPAPTSEQDAQALEQPIEVQSLRSEEGRRLEESEVRERRRERREGAEVVREMDDRFIVNFNNTTVIQSDDRPRLTAGADEVYYEELPRGRTREVIVRPNGVEIVTIRDRYGDVIKRSRFSPDGREYVLVYADDRRFDDERPRRWRDPARDLPPLELTIPVSQYILEANRVEDPDIYYEFLDQPPVEQVREVYTIDEVKYSSRVRDIARRVDLDTLTFDFGSASISQSEVPRLQGVADAIARMLDENPAETFLIEGHTDAVGSDAANLALSDQRAEAVAVALTDFFDIPPENLVTQGYGEQYLKVNTEEEERRNRRVAIRRITQLVAPVAQAQ